MEIQSLFTPAPSLPSLQCCNASTDLLQVLLPVTCSEHGTVSPRLLNSQRSTAAGNGEGVHRHCQHRDHHSGVHPAVTAAAPSVRRHFLLRAERAVCHRAFQPRSCALQGREACHYPEQVAGEEVERRHEAVLAETL